ncbi:MAG: MOSC domain-containing protein [Actinomycetes bacterium]
MRTVPELVATVPQVGAVAWIGVRTERRGTVAPVDEVDAVVGLGLAGDHRAATRRPDPRTRRQVTLLQAEHLPVVAALVGRDRVDPALLRRNVAIAGLPLQATRERRLALGPDVVLEVTGWCHPCSRMEEALGPGGYQAVRGHGGVTARVLAGGRFRVGDEVRVLDDPADDVGDDGGSAPG